MLVSELMLQQTQVARVIAPYRRFLARFPSPVALAGASQAEVVRAWAGLGYNRRAVHLHRLAVAVVEDHGGRLPADLDALLALPGVGPYTARAVLAFAFGVDVGVVDTNSARVLARAVQGRTLTQAEAQATADGLVPTGRGWSWNQSMLDLGATVCTKAAPRCDACPLRTGCAWAIAGFAQPDPALGSAGTSRVQSRFTGSDRQGRGRLVDTLRRGPVADAEVPLVAGWPGDPQRAWRVAESLVADGLAAVGPDGLTLA